VPRRTLRRAVLAELALILAFGTIIGTATGLAAAVLVLRDVPEFISRPAVPPLSYVPSAGPLALLLGAAAALLVVAAVTASVLLIRGVSLEQLRESPP
jgi:predicted lysophospholipase L1 biosynthesis ABC-type transport system permease subunit